VELPVTGPRTETGFNTQMPVAKEDSAKRDVARTRPTGSPYAGSQRIGESGNIEVAVLIALVLAANIVVATIVWRVVGSLLR
jgi:hypothetical protein